MAEKPPLVSSDGRLREIGIINWVICKIAARAVGADRMHLFTVLAQHKRLFRAWLPYSGVLLRGGLLPKEYTEVVILRVASLRECEYELQHHAHLAERAGIGPEAQRSIFTGRQDPGLTYHQRALVVAVDEFLCAGLITRGTLNWLSNFLTPPQIIELCTLIGQYDALAATIATLQVSLDFPDRDPVVPDGAFE